MAEMVGNPIAPAPDWTPGRMPAVPQDAERRLDAILAQIDRIPDHPAPFDPLDWDEHGLPR